MEKSRHREALVRAVKFMERGDPDAAHQIVTEVLNDEPDNPAALFTMGRILSQAGRYGVALHMQRQAVRICPTLHTAWNDLGMCLSSIQRFKDARDAFLEAHKRDGKEAMYVANVAMTYLEESNFKLALRWAEKALELDPECSGAKQTRGFASLALGDWRTGWAGYSRALGGKFRKIVKVDDEPLWDGTRVDTLFVFGEQGLGDEIMMASCLPDAARDVGKLVLECDKRLEGLFRRSFPQIDVYGTRREAHSAWVDKYKVDAGTGIGELPRFYRPTPESCPGTPYLVADPERRVMWRALLDSLGRKPKIGLCWSGGRKWTNSEGRSIGLEAFKPLMDAVDADWISLQYKDPSAEIAATGMNVKHWPHATQTADYDDLAALVAELDMVIGVNTAAHHLAGALGVPAVVLVPCRELWIWSLEPMPWYRSARTFKQRAGEPWRQTIQRLVGDPEHLDRIRSARGSSIPCDRPVDPRHGERPGDDQAAGADDVAEVPQPSGRDERVHHLPVLNPIASGLQRLGAVH